MTRATAAAALALLWAGEAGAQSRMLCEPHAQLTARLAEKYQESVTSYGIHSNGSLFQVYTTKDGATWTAVQRLANGQSCIIGAGESWTAKPVPAAEETGA